MWYYIVPSTGYRNDGPPLFITYNLRKLLDGKDALQNNKVMGEKDGNVVRVQPNLANPGMGTFDLNILVDHGEDAISVPLDFRLPSPSAYWVSDAHLGYDYRLKRAREMDFVFLAQKDFIEKFAKDGIPREKLFYLPHAAEPACYHPEPITERWDWCFIGHLNNDFRIDLCDRFVKEFGLGDGKGYLGWRMPEVHGHNVLEDVSRKFCQSRIVLNENIKEDVNMRTFETLACRRLLLTEDIPELHGLYQDGKHLVMYRSIDEAVEKARYYLANPEERNRIAQAGYEKFLANDTYEHRVQTILKTCLNYEPKEKELTCLSGS